MCWDRDEGREAGWFGLSSTIGVLPKNSSLSMLLLMGRCSILSEQGAKMILYDMPGRHSILGSSVASRGFIIPWCV